MVNVSKMMSFLLFIVVSAEASVVRPSVESSDKHFFGKDYPWDKRPIADKHYVFDHPYPAVQDSSDFDKDFVKDENSDGGKWQAQMDYDTLRVKIRKQKEKLDALKQKMEKEYKDYQSAKKEAESRYDEVQKSKKEVDEAKGAAEDAIKRVNDLEGGSQANGTKTGGAIGRAIEDVNKEMEDLEKCKERLAKAKEKLKKLLKQREEEETKLEELAKEKPAKDEKDADKEEEKEEDKKGKDKDKDGKGNDKAGEEKEDGKKGTTKDKTNSAKGKDAAGKDQDEEPSAAEKKAKRIAQEVKKDTKIASDERTKYMKQLEDVKRTEKQLEAAAKTLKKFRRPYVDGNGGIYNVPESHAMSGKQPSAIVMLLALMLAQWLS